MGLRILQFLQKINWKYNNGVNHKSHNFKINKDK